MLVRFLAGLMDGGPRLNADDVNQARQASCARADAADLVEIQHTLRQIINVKGD